MKRLAPVLAFVLALLACSQDSANALDDSGRRRLTHSTATWRATRRAYDGAPPVIPHTPFQGECTTCHNDRGIEVAGVGFAPPSPHVRTAGLSLLSRCNQCHVYRATDSLFRPSTFTGFPQDLRAGTRQHEAAPPVLPHPVFMRENCQACHTGPAAREEIRTSHPERQNCRQCHVPGTTEDLFRR